VKSAGEVNKLEEITKILESYEGRIRELEDKVSKLQSIIQNSTILDQEKCPHHETTVDYKFDGENEIQYEYCDSCGKEWS